MGTKRTKKTAVRGTVSAKAFKAYRQVEPAMRPLVELFAAVDDVMGEPDAFDPNQIHKSLGRIYRAWLDSREQLDPDFDRARYRHDMKAHQAAKPRLSPLGRKLPASGSRTSSSGSTSTSEKKPKKSARPEKPSVRKSAQGARSESNASGGRSRTTRSTEYGAGSQGGSGSGSRSGSAKRATARSPKRKD